MTAQEFHQEYYRLAHSIQSAVAWQEGQSRSSYDELGKQFTPKHLRVGIDTAKAELAGLAQLLISKGVITEEEYFQAVLTALQQELELQTQLCQRHGLRRS